METLPDRDFGTWNQPGAPFTIQYSLPIFHNIDFLVGEGFLRIPFGGIEHGGLLFGRYSESTLQIEAFRPIECEHASGPSFSLSENDLQQVQAQLDSFQADEELSGLQPLGLFVSHSRRDLRVTDHEEEWLNLLFPQRWQVLLLVKPEKFKPSLFAFAWREAQGITHRDLASEAFHLPMPARSERRARRPALPAEPELSPPAPALEEAKPQRERTRRTALKLQALTEELPVAEPEPPAETPERPAAVSSRKQRKPRLLPVLPEDAPSVPAAEPSVPLPLPSRLLRSVSAAAASFCVLFCWAWFYWNYLQAPVPMHAVLTQAGLVVTWPSGETESAGKADLRITNGAHQQQRHLSAEEKTNGQVTLAADNEDVTVELTAYGVLHDRHGVLRIVKSR
jgi:hypothetical protein